MLASLTRPRPGLGIAGKQPLAVPHCTGKARHGMPERHDRPAILAIARAISAGVRPRRFKSSPGMTTWAGPDRADGDRRQSRVEIDRARLIKIERSDLSKCQVPWANEGR